MRKWLRASGWRGWLTGGTVRDLLLGLEPVDVDLVICGNPVAPARSFADAIGGSFVNLSEAFQTCRVVSADRLNNYDFAARRGDDIVDDLGCRDFSINAMAVELPGGAAVIDPFGGQAALAARRIEAVSDDVFHQDPLRLLRGLRLERQTGFTLAETTVALIRRDCALANDPAPERVFGELLRLLAAPGTAAAVRRLDETGLLKIVFPEIDALKGVAQNDYHHLDVFEHTLAAVTVMDDLVNEPARYFPGQADQLRERDRLKFGGGTGRDFILGFAELMHDVAKPGCAFTDTDGQIRFFEHDRKGAEVATNILSRLRASARTIAAVGYLVGSHMRFEGLLQLDPPTPRARLRYLRATAPLTPEAIMMSVADRLAVRGRLVTEAHIDRHLALAREMMAEFFTAAAATPLPILVNGDDLIRELSLQPGPNLGNLLEHIQEEQALGRISSHAEAITAARRWLQDTNPSGPNP